MTTPRYGDDLAHVHIAGFWGRAERASPRVVARLDALRERLGPGLVVDLGCGGGPVDPVLLGHGDLPVDAVANGVGAGQVFDCMAADLIRAGAVTEVLVDRSAPGPPVHARTLPGRRAVPKVRGILDLFAELLGPPGAR